jgi:hypothetical protein
MRVIRTGLWLLGLATVVVFSLCVPAYAGIYSSSSEQQVVPGVTKRTIWSEDQVAVYRLPQNVTHVGNIHVELTYSPADRDCAVCLLDETGAVLPGTYRQGRLGLSPGKEIIDYAVTAVAHPELNPQLDGNEITGDAYYILVQALNATSYYRLRGYLPRTRDGETDTTSPETRTRTSLQVPAKATAWARVSGAPYGGAWDFKPTSEGTVYARLEYPALARSHIVTPLSATTMPAGFEQYVYPSLWQPIGGVLPVSQPTYDDTTGLYDLTHWDLYDLNRHVSCAPVAGGAWYGLEGTFTVQKSSAWRPSQMYHYVPVLWAKSSDPSKGPAAAPALGTRTVGYKATLLIPQNLRLASATKVVRRGRTATFRGTLALPAGPTPDAKVSWAPLGTRLQIQRKSGSVWVVVKKVATGAGGAWTAKLKMTSTGTYRAYWPGDGTLPVEVSLTRRVAVRR